MRRGLLVVLLLLLSVLGANAQTLDKAWEATGFANPESVVWDGERKVLYVSNVNGKPDDKDGNGYISKLSAEGKVLAKKWLVGLDGPKGMAVREGRLYIADIDRLVEVDTATAKQVRSYPAVTAKFLNDVTIDEAGAVYVSDLLGDAIWRLVEGHFEKWLADPRLQSPNGLTAQRGAVVVASWGPRSGQGLGTKTPGRLKTVSLADKTIRDISAEIGNLDGVEADGRGGFLVSDYVQGVVYRVDHAGQAKPILKLSEGAADFCTIPGRKLLLMPMMNDGKVTAYRLP